MMPVHKIHTRHIGGEPPTRLYRSLIRQSVLMALKSEEVDLPCVVNVLIADDDTIRAYNEKFRGIDKATDVLSFPMQEFTEPGWHSISNTDIDLDTETVPLGDIVLSTETLRRNARRYKHTFEHETTRMIIHSAMHLLGFEHGAIMEEKEENLLKDMGYS